MTETTASSSRLTELSTTRFGDGLGLIAAADAVRASTFGQLPNKHRAEFGQFGTPAPVAQLMASMFGELPQEVRLLDAGAGVGSLTAAFVAEALHRPQRPRAIHVTAFEIEPRLLDGLRRTLEACQEACAGTTTRFTAQVVQEDFVEACLLNAQEGAFIGNRPRYNCAIQNPPYRKIRSDSDHRRLLRRLGIETSNLYSAFVALTVRLLDKCGQLVAITPRSFCNGPYFKPVAKALFQAHLSVQTPGAMTPHPQTRSSGAVRKQTMRMSSKQASYHKPPIRNDRRMPSPPKPRLATMKTVSATSEQQQS